MNTIQPDRHDVVQMEPNHSLVGNRTFTSVQFYLALRKLLVNTQKDQEWVEEGVDCYFLDASAGGGWQKGKMRLRLEFVPDELEPEPERSLSALVLSPGSEPQ